LGNIIVKNTTKIKISNI